MKVEFHEIQPKKAISTRMADANIGKVRYKSSFAVHFLNLFILLCLIEQPNGFLLRFSQTIAVGDAAQSFLFNSMKIHENPNIARKFTEINVTLKTAETLYELVNQYSFFDPEVQLQCECECHDYFPNTRDIRIQRKIEVCQKIRNESTSCTNIDQKGIGYSYCYKLFHASCQMYFKANSSDKYDVVALRKLNSSYKLELGVRYATGNEIKMELSLSDNVNRVLFDDILIEWVPNYEEEFNSLNYWYIKKRSGNRLLQYGPKENFNEKGENDLAKVGWFQVTDDGLAQKVPKSKIYGNIKFNLNSCNGYQSIFNWKLKAFHLYPDRQYFVSPFQANAKVDLSKYFKVLNNRVTFGQSKARINVNLVHPYQEEMENLLEIFHKNGRTLLLLVKREGLFRVWYNPVETIETPDSFILNSTNASPQNLFCSEIVLSFTLSDPFLVCVQELNDPTNQLCLMARPISVAFSCHDFENRDIKIDHYGRKRGNHTKPLPDIQHPWKLFQMSNPTEYSITLMVVVAVNTIVLIVMLSLCVYIPCVLRKPPPKKLRCGDSCLICKQRRNRKYSTV